MKSDPVTTADLRRSVIAVPPLARTAAFELERDENRKIIRHLESGGVTTLMYGGNANFYNLSVSELAPLCEMLAELASEASWVIPSVGADYGKALDQLRVLRDLPFPTAMLLPLAFPATPSGVATGIRRLANSYGRPLIAYVKAEGYLTPRDVTALLADGSVCAVKYAVVREDPAEDPFLGELIERVGTDRIISGIGERPVIDHWTKFGLRAFTSGSVCIAPRLSDLIRRALQDGDVARAAALREHFLPLEDLRDGHSPLRVLHEAVRLAGIAETGPLLPFLDGFEDDAVLEAIGAAAAELAGENAKAAETELAD